jgi:hypothetical protein
MEYKVLSGPFNAGELERDLNGHAAEGGGHLDLPGLLTPGRGHYRHVLRRL